MNKKELYIFRHGQTDWNKQRRLQGHADIPLNEIGRAQAQALQSFFLKNPMEIVFSSDLDRAIETASIAVQVPREKIQVHSGLKEVKLGILEGVYEEQFVSQFGDEDINKWRSFEADNNDFAFEGGESRKDCNLRFLNTLHEICSQYSFKKAALCSHGFILRRAFHHILKEQEIPPMIANCVVFKLEYLNGHFSLCSEPLFAP